MHMKTKDESTHKALFRSWMRAALTRYMALVAPEVFMDVYAMNLYLHAELCAEFGKKRRAKRNYKKALRVYQRLEKKYHGEYVSDIKEIQGYLSRMA